MSNVLESVFSAKTAVSVKKQKVTQWITLKEAAQLLSVKIYTIRTLEWDNELGPRKTIGRRVYVQRSAVLAYSKTKAGDGNIQTQMTRKEYGQRVLDWVKGIEDIVSEDKEVIADNEFYGKLRALLNRYEAIAETLAK